jgi:hypothetical protein
LVVESRRVLSEELGLMEDDLEALDPDPTIRIEKASEGDDTEAKRMATTVANLRKVESVMNVMIDGCVVKEQRK